MDNRLTNLEHLRAGFDAAREYTARSVAEIGMAAVEAIEEIETVKVDKTSAVAVVIPAEGWSMDEMTDYPYYYDIVSEDVTERDRADIIIAPGCMNTAIACGLCPTSETLEGKIRVRSVSVPDAGINAEYWIVQGLAEQGEE